MSRDLDVPKRVYLTPLLLHGVPMLAAATGPRFLAPHELRVLTDDALQTLSWVANELFDVAFDAERFALAHDVAQLVSTIDKEQKRRAGHV